jgi:pyruvate dehydrogenase E2 component (dihydrolipoamide acetyltransferase)
MATDFTLPELGENVTSGDVVRILVAAGDTIAKDQPVLELETDKATIEVPSSVGGTVTDIKVKQGDRIKVGQVVLTVEGGAGAAASAEPKPKRGEVVDIGRGARAGAPTAPPPAAEEPPSAASRDDGPAPAAAPSVRRLARELGVDIRRVNGTGPDGRISPEDVQSFVRSALAGGGGGAAASTPLPDLAKWGEIERKPMSNIRRKTAEHLSHAWTVIPHVTQHDKADITAVEALRTKYSPQVEQAGGKLTVTAIALKIVAVAMKQFPQFNAAVDMARQEIVYKKSIHLGVAVDTERGLLVPVIRDVDRKGIVELSVELTKASDKARAGKLSLDEMQGGGMTITNLGGIGGTSFTPIVNWPEVAILGISRGAYEPVRREATGDEAAGFEARLMLPLSLSYDHRVIDGADAARFLRWVCDAFEQPFVMAL